MPEQIFKVCPHCEERNSLQLKVCPKCGFRFKTTSKLVWVCLFVVFVTLMVVTFNQVLKGTTLYTNLSGDPQDYQQDIREDITVDSKNIIYAFFQEGVIFRMDAVKNAVYANRKKWTALNKEEREMLAVSAANLFAFENKNDLFTVDIMDAVSNKKIAQYSEDQGLKTF